MKQFVKEYVLLSTEQNFRHSNVAFKNINKVNYSINGFNKPTNPAAFWQAEKNWPQPVPRLLFRKPPLYRDNSHQVTWITLLFLIQLMSVGLPQQDTMFSNSKHWAWMSIMTGWQANNFFSANARFYKHCTDCTDHSVSGRPWPKQPNGVSNSQRSLLGSCM